MKSAPNNHYQQQNGPGAWYYEMSLPDEATSSESASTGIQGDDCSPLMDLMIMGEGIPLPKITEFVEVPSSEHVAEIVGRHGCKIKALLEKTSTNIRSPPRNEKPVFLITGRPENVKEAKHEIELAAEHFTQIRASRLHSKSGVPVPGQVTSHIRVPNRVVGLVIGPKGATIKRIQQESNTYIVTPSREQEPIFEVTGLSHNVELARREIEKHIYQRTGNMPITNSDSSASIQNYEMIPLATATNNISRISPSEYNNLQNQQQQQKKVQQPQMRRCMSDYENNELYENENIYKSELRADDKKVYSNLDSPPSPDSFYNNFLKSSQQPQQQLKGLCEMINNENIYHPTQNFQSQSQHQSCEPAERMMPTTFNNENRLFNNEFLPNAAPWLNSLNSTNNYFSSSLSNTAHSTNDEGLRDSSSSTTFNIFNNDATFHMLSSIWG